MGLRMAVLHLARCLGDARIGNSSFQLIVPDSRAAHYGWVWAIRLMTGLSLKTMVERLGSRPDSDTTAVAV